MFKISRKLEYGLMVLKYISQKADSELCTAREICDSLDIPFDPTSKVMQQLGAKNILSSHQGKSGGYFMGKTLDQISYADLTEAIEGKLDNIRCTSGECEQMNVCNILSPIQKLNIKAQKFYLDVKLDDLFRAN